MSSVNTEPRRDQTSASEFVNPPRPFCLDQDDIHVWQVDLDGSRSLGPVDLEVLSDDEHARSVRYKFARDRHRFVVGRVSLRRILSAYTGIAARDIRFSYGEFGKPALAPVPGCAVDDLHSISFNCSHSGGVFVCAISGGGPIGADIEQFRPIDDPVGLARGYFSTTEMDALKSVEADQRLLAFFNGWTRKEAYIKATGKGLSTPLDSFSVSLSPGQEARLLSCAEVPSHTEIFSLYSLTAMPGYVGAIVAKGATHSISLWRCPQSMIEPDQSE